MDLGAQWSVGAALAGQALTADGVYTADQVNYITVRPNRGVQRCHDTAAAGSGSRAPRCVGGHRPLHTVKCLHIFFAYPFIFFAEGTKIQSPEFLQTSKNPSILVTWLRQLGFLQAPWALTKS